MGKDWGMSAKNLLYWNALLKMKRRKLDEAVSYVENLKKIDPKNSRLPFLYRSLAKNFKGFVYLVIIRNIQNII